MSETEFKTGIRWMVRKDIPRVLEIESRYGLKEDQWSFEDFIKHLQERNCIGKVLTCKLQASSKKLDGVCGFCVYELHRDFVPIIKLKVDPAHRNRGCGRKMIDHLKEKLHPKRRTKLMVDIHERNRDGIRFLQCQQFKALAVLRSYYHDGSDSYAMSYDINTFANARTAVERLGVRRESK